MTLFSSFPSLLLFTPAFLLLLYGCTDDTGTGNADTNSANQMTSMNTSTTDTVCMPKVQCQAGVCGRIEDGCGSMIECGLCECESGSFTGADTSCGPCGLGVKSCASGLNGKARCSLESLEAYGLPADPGQEVCATRLVYVEASSGPKGDGTKANPYSSYADAMATIKANQVILLSNRGEFTEALTLQNGIHVLGGYTRRGNQWSKDAMLKTKISVPRAFGKDQVGIFAKDLPDSTLIEGIELALADASSSPTYPVYNSVGILAQNAKDLRIQGSVIVSGRPSFGIAGKEGKPGVDGSDGQKGRNGTLCYDRTIGGYRPQPEGGLGGKQMACEEADGGDGGASGGYSREGLVPPVLKVALPGKPGEGQGFGAGGAAGTVVKVAVPDGLDGEDGAPAKQAVSSLAQGSWEAQGGQLEWVYQGDGGDGHRGEIGSGGGGGGGQTYYEIDSAYSWGPSGGGGGSGGCPGGAGGGGKAGGSSFGIVLYDSSLRLSSTKVQAALGGVGGQGASGGPGGGGGAAGEPGLTTLYYNEVTGMVQTAPSQSVAPAGAGGRGGSGSAGSAGAGGAGGASVAVYCASGGTLVTDESTELVTNGAAPGGGSAEGIPGAPGLSATTQRCE